MAPDVFDEICMATLLLPLAQTSLRWPVDPRVSMTDATPSRLGAVSATVSDELAEALYRTCETRGAYTRLDMRTLQCDAIEEGSEPLAGEICNSTPWATHRSD